MTPVILQFPLPIITPRLLLQLPISTTTAAQEYVNAVTESLPEISTWLPWAKFCPTVAQTEEYIKNCHASWITYYNNDIGLPLWIFEKTQNRFLGNINIWNIVRNIPKFELGFWLRTTATHNGYITEALNALIRYCFIQLGVKRIEIRCEKENHLPQVVAKRLGFQLEGVLRNSTRAVSDSTLTDVLLFSRIDLKNLPEIAVSWPTDNKKTNN